MSLWLTRHFLVYYDDMVRPPPLALAATHPLVRAAVESNTDCVGCGVYQACGLHVALRRSFEDHGFSTYRSVLESVVGEQLDALTDTTRASSVDFAVHRPEDDHVDDTTRTDVDVSAAPGAVLDCQAAAPRGAPHSATAATAQFFYAAIGAGVDARAALLRSGEGAGAHTGASCGGDLPLAATAPVASSLYSAVSFAPDTNVSEVCVPVKTTASGLSGAPTAAPRPFFTEATPRAALPSLRRVVHAVYAPRIPYRVLEAMAWWFWRQETGAPLEYIGSAFVGLLPTAHRGTALATLFTAQPKSEKTSTEAPLTKPPALISLRLRGFAHLRSTLNTEPTADLIAIAKDAPQLQLLQLSGLSALNVRAFHKQPRPFLFLFHLDLCNTDIYSLDFLRRSPSLVRDGETSSSPFPFLRVLNISGCFSVASLAALPELPELVVLVAAHVDSLAFVTPLAECPKLEEVDLSHCSSLQSVAPLAACRVLRALRVVGCRALKSLGSLLLDSAAAASLEYLNVHQCPLITSLFSLDESDGRAGENFAELLFGHQWGFVGHWPVRQELAPPQQQQQQEAERAERSAAAQATAVPDAFRRTRLRYLNIAGTGLRLQTAESLVHLLDLGHTDAHRYPSHLVHWISALCPDLEQLNVSHCPPRSWTPATTADSADAQVESFARRLDASARAARVPVKTLQTVDLSPLRTLPKLRKLVARGLKRASFATPSTAWRVMGCCAHVHGEAPDESAAVMAALGSLPHVSARAEAARLCWLDMEATALALPVTLRVSTPPPPPSPSPATTTTTTTDSVEGTRTHCELDGEALSAQLARDATVQWLRSLAHAFFYLRLPTFTTTDPLEVHTVASAWDNTAYTLDQALHLLVESELWRPLPAQASGIVFDMASSTSASAPALSPPTPFTGLGGRSSSSWGTAQSGMLSGPSTGTFPPVLFSDHQTAPAPAPAPSSSASSLLLQPYVSRLHHLHVTTPFLTSSEAAAREAAAVMPQATPSLFTEAALARRVPFVLPAQLRRLTLNEPADCPMYGRGAWATSAGAELESPVEEEDDVAGVERFQRPEDYLFRYSVLDQQAIRAADEGVAAAAAAQWTDGVASSVKSQTLSGAVSPEASYKGASLSISPMSNPVSGASCDWQRVRRRVGWSAFTALLEVFPFVEELALYQCTRSLRSLTPILCLPRLWAAAGNADEGIEKDGELCRRALFEASARALADATATPSLSVSSPYLTYSALRVLDASFAARLVSLGPLAQCCPLLERVSLRNCMELRSLRGLHGAQHLRFLDARVTGITAVLDLAQRCPRLAWIDLSGSRKLKTLTGLGGAANLRYLRACRLPLLETILELDEAFYAAVASGGLLPDPHFPQLVELDVRGTDTLTSLASMGLAPRLERCCANSGRLVALPLVPVQCPSLKQLSLLSVWKLRDITGLGGALQLRELKLVMAEVEEVHCLSTCPQLSFVELITCKSLQTVAGLASAPSLSLLILDNSAVLDLGDLDTCPALEHVSVIGCGFQASTRPRAKTSLATSDDVFDGYKNAAAAVLQRLREHGVSVREVEKPQ